jgi:hypothetical protein
MINFLILIGVLKAANQAERAADYLDDRDGDDEMRDAWGVVGLIAGFFLWPVMVPIRLRMWIALLVLAPIGVLLFALDVVWLYFLIGFIWVVIYELPCLAAENARRS